MVQPFMLELSRRSWCSRLAGALEDVMVAPSAVHAGAHDGNKEKGQQGEPALGLLGRMPCRRVAPNVISYSAAVRADEQ